MLLYLCCKKTPKWSELLYIQIFIALCLDDETQKEFKTCVAHGESSSKDMQDILIYPMGPWKQRGATPCLLGVAVAAEEATVPAAAVAQTEATPQTGDPPPAKAFGRREDTAGDEKRPHPHSGTSSLYPGLPTGPSSVQRALSALCVTHQLPLQFCLSGFLMEIKEE